MTIGNETTIDDVLDSLPDEQYRNFLNDYIEELEDNIAELKEVIIAARDALVCDWGDF